jgi:hypothetical protein
LLPRGVNDLVDVTRYTAEVASRAEPKMSMTGATL